MQEVYDIKVLKTTAYLHFYAVGKQFKHKKEKNENKKKPKNNTIIRL
jgi:hypothetical protein